MSSGKRTRNALSLKKKYELIEMSRKNPRLTSRILAEKFECGETQVNTMLTKQESIREQYESNISSDSILLGKRSRSCEFGDINESLYRWYSMATSWNISPSRPQLCEKAKLIAEQLCIYNFKASNRTRNTLSLKKKYELIEMNRKNPRLTSRILARMKINGESGDVSGETVDSWKELLLS